MKHRGTSGSPGAVAVVTGSNTGVGFETASGLGQSGRFGTVVVACRSRERGLDAVSRLESLHRHRSNLRPCEYRWLALDLSELASVRAFVAEVLALGCPVRLLVNNAGANTSGSESGLTRDGFEWLWQCNYLGHFCLTELLLPSLRESSPSRIVNVSSVMHRFVSPPADFESCSRTPHFAASYRYSKLAQVLHSAELARRLAGTGVAVASVSPGAVDSSIWRHESSCSQLVVGSFRRLAFLSAAQGAATSLHAALDWDPAGWEGRAAYFGPYRVPRCAQTLFAMIGPFAGPQLETPSALGRDATVAAALWDLSSRQCGLPDETGKQQQ